MLYDLTYTWNLKQNKTKKTHKKEIRSVVTKGRGWGEGELNESGQNVLTSSYKINKYQGCNVQHDDYS